MARGGVGLRLAGEIALVTGSTSGLGKELARAFAAEGARVMVTGRDLARGEAVVASIAEAGGEAAFAAADLRNEGACAALVAETVERFGGLTVLVNNAVGRNGHADGPAADVTTEAWEAILRVNLTAAILLSRFAIREMRKTGRGSILNISSRVASRGTPGLAAYTASKGALEALTRSIAVDYARDGIRCNAISLGYILHETRDASMDETARREREGMHLTRLGTPADVANGAIYLASAESEYITGIVLPLDGGSTAARGRVLG